MIAPAPRQRRIYLDLLKEMESAKEHLDRISDRIHRLLDFYDEIEAERIRAEHDLWMNEGDNDNA